jgi:hypothetical protein
MASSASPAAPPPLDCARLDHVYALLSGADDELRDLALPDNLDLAARVDIQTARAKVALAISRLELRALKRPKAS